MTRRVLAVGRVERPTLREVVTDGTLDIPWDLNAFKIVRVRVVHAEDDEIKLTTFTDVKGP